MKNQLHILYYWIYIVFLKLFFFSCLMSSHYIYGNKRDKLVIEKKLLPFTVITQRGVMAWLVVQILRKQSF